MHNAYALCTSHSESSTSIIAYTQRRPTYNPFSCSLQWHSELHWAGYKCIYCCCGCCKAFSISLDRTLCAPHARRVAKNVVLWRWQLHKLCADLFILLNRLSSFVVPSFPALSPPPACVCCLFVCFFPLFVCLFAVMPKIEHTKQFLCNICAELTHPMKNYVANCCSIERAQRHVEPCACVCVRVFTLFDSFTYFYSCPKDISAVLHVMSCGQRFIVNMIGRTASSSSSSSKPKSFEVVTLFWLLPKCFALICGHFELSTVTLRQAN